MKIAIVGYGKMGKEIEKIALEKNHEIVARISSENQDEDWGACDVAIEFSQPDIVLKNIQTALDRNIPLIVGTTGWYKEINKVKKLVEMNNGSLLYASNFSLGMNIFFKINKALAEMTSGEDYEAKIEETHHTQKLDKPSGTAITLANDVIMKNTKYIEWKLDSEEANNILPVHAIRKDDVKGFHKVIYKGLNDKIEISHEAFNRSGFAAGAIIAAEWIIDKQGVFTFQEMLNF